MAPHRTEGIVLRTRNLGEADKILAIITPDDGKIEAVARGSRRSGSRLLSVAQPFVQARLLLQRRPHRTLDTLSQADIQNAFRPLREDLTRFAYAGVAVETADALLPLRDPHPRVYALMQGGLELLARVEPQALDLALRAVQLKLVCMMGFRPRLDQCAGCERPLAGEVRFSCELGGAICPDCAARDPVALPLGTGGVAWLRRLFALEFARLPEAAGERLPPVVSRVLNRYCEHVLERPLRS
ncbi:MAG TPA: DNA repair protein RecO, partial [Limnochordia bacterium]|nr:DNA repair protein RecO [Limnochordia bacterium]